MKSAALSDVISRQEKCLYQNREMEQETKICNNCKRAINVSSFVLHESHCARHIKLCLECGEPVPVREMEEHCRENHTPKPCDKCGEEVPPDQLEEHLEQSCTEVKVECKYCELEVRRGDYPEHTEGCGSRTDFCELCNQRVMLKEMNEHKAMKCGHMKAESPLRRYELEQMGLIGQDGGESDSGDEFNLPYHPHMIGRSVTPPPPYECHHDDSMRVDPHWLQTVAEACGEDNLDALLAQNVFYENMRSVRSGDHHVTSEPMRPRDSHVTTEDSSEDEGSVVREKPPSAYEDQGDLDNRLLDQDLATQLAATNEQDDFYLAQRMQEREVMGHSKTLYEERRVREIASEIEGRERNREVEGEERDRRERNREVEGEERDRELEGETEEVRSKPDMTEHLEQGEIAKELEERMVAKQMEVDEIAKKLKETNESQRLLARHLEKTKEEIDSLTLAAQLQKKDLAEGHRALWKNTAGTLQEDDESFARRLQMDEDRHQYGHTHLEEEEPRPKTPPTQPHIDDSSEKIPCQWCEKPIPFEQVMLHQQSCYNNLFGGGAQGGQGLHLSDDIFRRVETDDDLWQAEQFNVECQYCHVSISVNTLPTHEALCDANPDIHLKKVYESQVTPSSSLRHEPSPSLSCTGPEGAASATLLSVEKGPCEFCHEVIPLVQLVRHEAICKYTQPKPSLAPPTSSQHSPAPPPSSPTLLQGTTTASGGRRSLAIKFPTSNSDTTAHDSEGEEKDSSKRTQPDPIALSTTKVADDSTSHGFIPLSSSSSQGPGRGGMEVKATKKRQSPSETFDPWSGMREPVKKAPRTTEMGGASIVSHVNSVATRSAGSKSSKAVYSSTTSRNIYGANSKERGGNVLSSAAGVVPSLTKTQKRDSKSKASATVESIGTGVRKLALQSKPVTEGKSSSSTTSKPLSSNSNTTSRIKTLPAGNSKLQIAGTKVSGTISNPHSNATWVTGSHSTTTATKSVGGNNSKLHTNASRTGLRPHSIPSRSGSVGASTASTKPATTAASRRGRGQQSSSSNTVSRQQSSRGRGNGGSLSSRHSASASSVKDTKSKAKQTRT